MPRGDRIKEPRRDHHDRRQDVEERDKDRRPEPENQGCVAVGNVLRFSKLNCDILIILSTT